MLELILSFQKKSLRKEYLFRFVTIALVFAVFSVGAWFVSLIPSYIMVSSIKKDLSTQVEFLENSALARDKKEFDMLAIDIEDKLEIFTFHDPLYSKLIERLTALQGADISLSSIGLYRNAQKNPSIDIEGVAVDRLSLRNFATRISEDPWFANIEIPFSSFAREEDLPFSITLVYTAPPEEPPVTVPTEETAEETAGEAVEEITEAPSTTEQPVETSNEEQL